MLFGVEEESKENRQFSRLLITVAILNCILQLFWFGSKCFNQIDFDGMAYAGIARHLRQGEFHSSLNAFRSPLVSWLIAVLALVRPDYLRIGKVVSIGSFLLCMALLYVFTLQLWNSRLVAALAVLLLTLGRGLTAVVVAMVTPDFLFAALVLLYFSALLRCMRAGDLKNWFYVGVIHGLAFLTKAFALPWLAVCTAAAVLFTDKPRKTKAAQLGLAALIPVLAAVGWAMVLHSKYGIYTTGSQFKANLLQWTLHEYPQHREPTYKLLRDTEKALDEYVVADPMPPGSWAWTYHVSTKQAFPKLLWAEKNNIPKALKELTIVATPGILIAFVIALAILGRERDLYPVEWRMVAIIVVSFVSLIVAYGMLVFDDRYLFPLIPLVLAVGTRFLVADATLNRGRLWRRISIALVVLGVLASLVYSSSPFRVLTRDFQAAGYQAGALLARHDPEHSTLVSLGSGPYPERGVGWEAGYQAAYFGGETLIATMDSLPSSTELDTVLADLRKATPDVIAVWGRPSDRRYTDLVHDLVLQYPNHPVEKIADPVLGEVGVILFMAYNPASIRERGSR